MTMKCFWVRLVSLASILLVFMSLSANGFAKEETVIELESYIVGDKEQPAVSYFVPWQGTQAPDKLHWNIENKNDKTLKLIDRDVMVRSIRTYDEMKLEEKTNE